MNASYTALNTIRANALSNPHAASNFPVEIDDLMNQLLEV
jgi:hypothetical protein